MAIAKYFSKDLLAIKQIFAHGSLEKFEELLNAHVIEITFDAKALNKAGLATLDLLTRLVSRLYPRIKFTFLGEGTSPYTDQFAKLSSLINAGIEITEAPATLSIVVGESGCVRAGKVIFVGSDNWLAKISTKNPIGSQECSNPFGAGIAACLAASNAFRFVFKDHIQKELDDEAMFDLLNLNSSVNHSIVPPDLDVVELGVIHLAGMGAIGSGFLWGLASLPGAKGELIIVDPEKISLSNLQRYVCTLEHDVDRPKVELAATYLSRSKLACIPFEGTWAEYMQNRENQIELVATAVDSARDRIGVQSSLPRLILNGYTETNISGVTRHLNFGTSACLVCGFVPEKKMRDYSQEVADNLGISNMENQVRHYVAYNFPVDDALLNMISQGNGISIEDLAQFRGQPFSSFYSNAVCGGMLLSLAGSSNLNASMEAPLAFQSALAGIMLASEVVLVKSGYRTALSLPNSTQVYPLLKINDLNPYTTNLSRDLTMRCICNDQDFKLVYEDKWRLNTSLA